MIWLKVPETIRIGLEGALQPGVFAKDIILKMLAELRSDGVAYQCMEFTGSAVEELTMASRMTLTNMAVELGAKAGIMPFDETTESYLAGRTKEGWEPIEADEDAHYRGRWELDVSSLEPQVACPHTVDNVKPNLEVRSKRVGGASYQVPMQVNKARQQSLAIRWILMAVREKKGRPTHLKLADEILAAYNKEGAAMTRRENTHRMADANKAFAHFAW